MCGQLVVYHQLRPMISTTQLGGFPYPTTLNKKPKASKENRIPPAGSKKETGVLDRVQALGAQEQTLGRKYNKLESKCEKEQEDLARERDQ